jgi:RNA polymerase-binding transcription factor DksA
MAQKLKSKGKAKAKVSKPKSKAKPVKNKPAQSKAKKPAKKVSAPMPPKVSAKKTIVTKKISSNQPVTTSSKPLFPIRTKKQNEGFIAKDVDRKVQQTKLNKKFLEQQHARLLDLKDHILDQMQGVAQDNLRSRSEGNEASAFGMHQADAGSDAYEKDFALSLLSQEQDALYEIEEAIKRIENNTYGICEMSGKMIPLERLEAIPFARYTVECQARYEKETKGKRRWDTSPQFMDSADNFFEEDEEVEDDDKSKSKE